MRKAAAVGCGSACYDAAMLKYLRIAVTAFSLAACTLLMALWVRSYWWWDSLDYKLHPKCAVAVDSAWGRVGFSLYRATGGEWNYFASRLDNGPPALSLDIPPTGIGVVTGAIGTAVYVHLWMLVVVFAALAAVSWLRWRFSLRTLLIGMTLVGMGLATIVVASR